MKALVLRFLGLLVLLGVSLFFIESHPVPTVFSLTNTDGFTVGQAFVLDSNQGLTAEHIWEKHQPVFHQENLIEVLVRDSDKDLLYFSLPKNLTNFVPAVVRSDAVQVGETLQWHNNTGLVSDIAAGIRIDERDYENLIVLTGSIAPGDSGRPVYDLKNTVVGIITGGDLESIYVVPIVD